MKHIYLLKIVILGLLAFFNQKAQSQSYNMPVTGSSSITVCSGIVYDNGGTGNYANNSNSTITINPGIAGNKISITFTSFSNAAGAAGGDWIDIYDGTSTSAPYLLEHLSANSNGFFFTQDETYTATNSSGAITIRFTSDGSGTDIGFSATIECLPRRPDLVIQSPSVVPNSFLPPGSIISVSSTIFNQGDAAASSSDVGYYLSTNTTFDASDVYLDKYTGASLTASTGSSITSYLTIPSETTAGNYYILFVADNGNLETESNEYNNVNYSAITVGVPFIDLTINSPSTSIPNIHVGTSFSASSKINNQGTTSATSSNVGYYLSTNTILDGSEVFLGSSSGSSLTAATSSTRSSTLTIPAATAPGNYYILFVADYSGLVSEQNETNNLNYVPITVYPPFTGIIVPSSGSNSVTVCSGEVYDNGGINDYLNNANGTLTINPGTAGSNVSLTFKSFNTVGNYDYLYIYNGTTTSAPLIGTYSGSTSPGTIKATNSSGALTLKFISDGGTAFSGFTATISCFVPTIDLEITSPSLGPTSILAGSMISISYTIGNNGNIPSIISNAGFYLSTNTTYEASDVYLSSASIASLPGSTSSPRTGTLTIPSGTAVGDYYILFIADYTNLVTETNESNNVSYSPVTVVPPYVDLTITVPFATPSSLPAGVSMYVSSKINNQGTISATSSNIGYYLSTNTTYDASDIYLGNSTGTSLSASAGSSKSATLTIPSGTADGNYYLLFVADYSNLVTESIETNNSSYVPITVSGVIVPYSGSNSVTLCSGTVYDHSGNDPYASNANGTLTIYPGAPGNYVSLNFSSFNVDRSDDLYIYDGTSTSATLIGVYYGSYFPGTIYATNPSGALTLRFSSDPVTTSSGFIATISCYIPTPDPDLTIKLPSVSPSSIPAGSNFRVTSNIYNQGIVSATSSNIGYYLSKNTVLDGSEVFLGYSSGSSLSPGTSSYRNPSLTIPTTTIPGNYNILFVADYSALVNEGNETNNLSYVPVAISPQITGIVVPYTGTNSVTVCSGTLYDHAGTSDYANDANGVLTIYSETAGSNVSLTFSSFNTESSDYLYIYDGTSTSATLIGKYSGTTSPGIIKATNSSGALTLKFTSDLSVTRSGFVASVSCFTPTPDLVITSSAVSPANVAAGSNVSLTSIINNQGTTSASSSDIGYYLSTNTTYDASDIFLGYSSGSSLAISTSSAVSSAITIPSETTIGSYYVLFIADYNNNVTENDETNNVVYKSLTVSLPTIDLVIQNPTASPTNVVSGSTVSVSSYIYNQGTVSSSSSDVGYYLSTNTTYDVSDVYLGSTAGGPLAVSTSSARNATVTIPSETIGGTYYILFVADYNDNVTESNETNNVAYKSFTVSLPTIDLVIQAPAASPTNVVAGSTISVSSNIYNQGTGSASSSDVGYYLSTNTTYDVSDVYLGSTAGGSLAVSTSAARSATVTIPSGTTSGSYYILYIADYNNKITETNETNNVNYTNITVTLSTIDLVIQTPETSPTSVFAGSIVSVSSFIYNQGTTTAPSSNVGYYLSANTTYDVSDIYLGYSSGSTLPALTSSYIISSVIIPSTTISGNYFLLYVADYNGLVTESNETNNINYSTISIVTSAVDLIIKSPNVTPTSTYPGATVSLDLSVYNQGNTMATTSDVGYYLSSNTTYEASDVFLGYSIGNSLSAAASSDISTTVTIPSGTAVGTYYLLIVADPYKMVAESDKTNNLYYTTFEVIANVPDLVIQTPKVSPTSIIAGSSVNVDSYIYNQGTASASASNIGYYLSTNTTFDASDIYLGYSSGSTLSASTSSARSTDITIPSETASGSYYVLFVADYNNDVVESYETNNVNYTALEIIVATIDLIIQSPTTSPTSVVAGSSISVSSSIYNQGTAYATSSNVGYYLSTNTTFDASDVYLGYSSGGSLSASANSIMGSTVTIPSETTAGTYYVLFVADYTNDVTESNETNNVNYASITVSQLPDLSSTELTLPSSIYTIGATIPLSHSVKNNGLGDASLSIVKYYLSSDEIISVDDILLDSYSLIGITTGEASTININLTLSSSINAGNYFLIAIVDADNTIDESNELNNIVIKSFTISIPNAIETKLIDNIRLYPNPTEGKFALEYTGGINNIVITIYNSLGLLIDSKSFVNSNGNDKKEFDLSNQTSGVYTIKVESEGRPHQFLKVVIQ